MNIEMIEPKCSTDEQIEAARKILARLCDRGLVKMSIPVRHDDEDIILAAVINRAAVADSAAEIARLRMLLDQRPSIVTVSAPEYVAWTERVYESDRTGQAAPAGRRIPVYVMPEPAPVVVPLSSMPELQGAVAAGLAAGTLQIVGDEAERSLEDQPEPELAALEREHMGDIDEGTGIYAPSEALRTFALAMTASRAALAAEIAGDIGVTDSPIFQAAQEARAALFEALEVPEGCTPNDARVLRHANHSLALEVHDLREQLDKLTAPKTAAQVEAARVLEASAMLQRAAA